MNETNPAAGPDRYSPEHIRLPLRRAGIDTYRQPVLYLREGCLVCRAEGFAALTRVKVTCGGREIVAILNVVTGDWLGPCEAALSDAAWQALAPQPGALAGFAHADPPESAGVLRAKVFGERLDEPRFAAVLRDVMTARLSDIELAAFVTACAGDRMDLDESVALTRAMIEVGERLDWGPGPVLDKHCVGGLPGNRTTPIVVSIVAALGHRVPKTSSRAITSPAGTADVMATMTNVDLESDTLRVVVEREGGCLASGGRMRLSPADDILIQIERPLDFDSDGQMVASILSKKVAAGSTHVLIDIPVGITAKIRTPAAADAIARRLAFVGEAVGLRVGVRYSDGSQPVGRGIGPALEAHDVLAVLRGIPYAPADLRERALDIAGAVLELLPGVAQGAGRAQAAAVLASGAALHKFMAICNAQGGFREPGVARFVRPLLAASSGTIACINNRQLARVAKLAGAPRDAAAGLVCTLREGDRVQRGDPLLVVHAESPGELAYALEYAHAHPDILTIAGEY
ncbi:thymidine phosphorylase family protein [Agrilutibacter solisilvae]|uniref:Putative thymidine phosphorylase n=1 Tax=Agrilutibacter solisilvae TaxID=2763317 RepID=A0A974XZP0_9GAMM|nr:thymidine phosphorylase family protein [Lysobacter solisilvae]QSX77775.1 thymidine phosphorylase family protein [Lysobacter solisilvae]